MLTIYEKISYIEDILKDYSINRHDFRILFVQINLKL